MRAAGYLVVEADKQYNNEEAGLIVNNTLESVEHINRMATVISAPRSTVLEEGDDVILHHNILRKRYTVGGNVESGRYRVEGNTYFVPLTEVFMYRRDSEWITLDPFCFVEPIKKRQEQGILITNLGDDKLTHKGNKKHQGIIRFVNKDLSEKGVNVGDHVIFSKHSEHEFVIGGCLLYKMKTSDILGICKD